MRVASNKLAVAVALVITLVAAGIARRADCARYRSAASSKLAPMAWRGR